MSSLNIIVIGPNGRMGKEVLKVIESSAEFNLLGTVSRSQPITDIELKKNTAVVDFSDSDYFSTLFDWCKQNRVPLVSGTTALTESDFNLIESADFPVLWAPNMSLGVAFVNKLIKEFKSLPKDFKCHTEETHHIHKKDSPSGTAIYLNDTLKQARSNNDVGEIVDYREGEVLGDHQVYAKSQEEEICVSHSAKSRSVWAKGALRSAQWLVRQPAGSYNIEDTLS